MSNRDVIERVRKYVRAKTEWAIAGISVRDGKLFFLMDGQRVEAIEAVKTYPAARLHAKKIIADMVDHNEPLVGVYRDLALEVLRSDMPSRKRGGQPIAQDPVNHSRDYRICVGIRVLEFVEVKPTAGPDKLKENTGCGIVADVLNLSYDAVATIWDQRNHHMKNGVATDVMIRYLIYPEQFPHMS